MSTLDDLLAAFGVMTPEERARIEADANELTKDRIWVPNIGPQTDAFFCDADELFYGGQAGGGKTDLIIGLAITDHQRSLLLRRQNADTTAIADRLEEMSGRRSGPSDKVIDIAGCQLERDKQKWKGRPHDLIGFDEISDFTESQYRFIIGWNRSTQPGQRSRVVAAGNPPTTPEGFWVLRYWAAWLDPTHPHPAKEGELRWYTTIDGKDVECEGPGALEVNGETIYPKSRTFIRSRLSDNPDLEASGYDRTLAALPHELRDAYRGGRFDAVLPDKPFQLIQTAHILAAESRWSPDGGDNIPMSCLAHDVALGGVNPDGNAWARRHGLWFDEVIKEISAPGVKLDPIDLAGRDMTLLRDHADLVIDMGGGFGSGVYSHIKNNVDFDMKKLHAHVGSSRSTLRSRDGKFKFKNLRSCVYWKFREALEPGLGVPIALPPDPELRADLAALTWKLTPQGVQITEKVDLVKDLGRSPDKGDCVVNAWFYGPPGVIVDYNQKQAIQRASQRNGGGPRVNLGHSAMKQRLRGR